MPELSIVLPCYNEAGNIPGLIERYRSLAGKAELEVLFVDNASEDGTGAAIDRELAREENERFETPLPAEELTGLVERACRRYPKGSLLQDWYLAKAIAELNRDNLRYCLEKKLFYVRGKYRWEPDPTGGLVTGLINEARSTWIVAASKNPDKAKTLIIALSVVKKLASLARRRSAQYVIARTLG